MFIGRTLLLIG